MTSRRRRALIVAYAFPPNAAVGSMRPMRWCRWLPKVSDWECAVLTVNKEPQRTDPSLLEQLPDNLEVVRTPILEPWHWLESPRKSHGFGLRTGRRLLARMFRPFAVPDAHTLWYRTMVPTGKKVIKDLGIEVVVATAPPWSNLLGAARLASSVKLPLILDFRDPWTEIERGPLPAWRRAWERRAERRVCEQAAAIISTSETYTRNLRSRCPEVPTDRFYTLHNGFDEEVFAAAPHPGVARDSLSVVHLGSLYARRLPFAALQGIGIWLRDRSELRSRFRLIFIGSIDRPTRDAVAAAGLDTCCEVTGHLPHLEAIARCRRADLLLLAMGSGELTPMGWLPSKLFEYLAVGRPVLAHTVDGEAAAMLRAAGADLLIAGDDPAAFAAALEEYWQDKMREGEAITHRNNPEVIDKLSQAWLARELAGILDSVAVRKN